jgi:hypothetical protein
MVTTAPRVVQKLVRGWLEKKVCHGCKDLKRFDFLGSGSEKRFGTYRH